MRKEGSHGGRSVAARQSIHVAVSIPAMASAAWLDEVQVRVVVRNRTLATAADFLTVLYAGQDLVCGARFSSSSPGV
jgi:hypothetical protein